MELKPIFDTAGPVLIAGPCGAESESQTLETARRLKEIGVKIFRAGVWKPRTKPGGFEGRGAEALQWLQKVKEQLGMTVITEIATPSHLQEALSHGIHNFWLGARTSANPFAVQDIADSLAALPEETKDKISVLIKNPVNPDLELWIGAIERIYGAGIKRIGAIHRGFSSYGKHLYRNQPRWAIPIELYRRLPGLPIIFDPSHISGRADLVGPLARQAASMHYDGLIIESHISPKEALSDAAQQVTPEELSAILQSIEKRSESNSFRSLDQLREKIDRLDDELLELLAKRMSISKEIGEFKREHKMPVFQADRYKKLMEKRVDDAAKLDLPEDFVRAILATIHEESVRQQISRG